ncbi:endoplasmic oxidoreductin-1 [Stereum hirsutum FP-91666 SS1]|uniref:endoplasmic oxidoreductin-1 n=1 Tax=Stereum hirsutum (strain FP-91666) TaxID=721885 RepID=UPI0004449420|nr:endoplasmic oxidoreductin-1 [Stereum hirsutum FP-91666 SS1]EIM81228.1 endoplasmic oxidoreductin-1 [Stereum hirsutum FP-91666 SS1]
MRPSLLPSALLALLIDWTNTHIHTHGVYAQSNAAFLNDNTLVRQGQVQNVLEHEPVHTASCEQSPTGPIETTMCNYESIESVNDELYRELHELVQTPFFKYFRADLYRECPFWEDNALCMNRDCVIATVDESEIPEKWRAKALSKLELPPEAERESLPGCYYRDSDFCFFDDMTEGDYVDLSLNPERFTGYAGVSASRVWTAIYEENCFGQSESELSLMSDPKKSEEGTQTIPETMTDLLSGEEEGAQCLEKRVYYKIVSGLHASISTHICYEHFNQTTGQWGPNLPCFVNRVASHPERLQYIYFNTVLLLRAVARIGPYLQAYDYCSSGTHEEDAETMRMLGKVIGIAGDVGKFDETVLFRGENANVLKEEFKAHFRNVTRIMDCVGCDKCRLWGKVQTTGVATALKILFELDEKALDPHTNANLLQRTEVVALINTLHRFSESLAAVEEFRKLWREASAADSEKLIKDAEDAAKRVRFVLLYIPHLDLLTLHAFVLTIRLFVM